MLMGNRISDLPGDTRGELPVTAPLTGISTAERCGCGQLICAIRIAMLSNPRKLIASGVTSGDGVGTMAGMDTPAVNGLLVHPSLSVSSINSGFDPKYDDAINVGMSKISRDETRSACSCETSRAYSPNDGIIRKTGPMDPIARLSAAIDAVEAIASTSDLQGAGQVVAQMLDMAREVPHDARALPLLDLVQDVLLRFSRTVTTQSPGPGP